jgi:hypothetical protein
VEETTMPRARTLLITVLALVAMAVAGFLIWFFVIRDDAPEEFGTGDLSEAVSGTTAPVPDQPATTGTEGSAPDATAAPATTEAPEPEADTGVDGVWNATQESQLGIAGTSATAAEFTVDMASVTSDSERRDGQFRTRIMSTDEFPTATFVLTAPIEFGAVPQPGEQITATATGDLTLRGVTRPVTFDVTAERGEGRIGVLGSIPILFSDFEIPDPSNGFAVVKDNGLLEFVLVFERA